ncbi:DNA-binding response regulator, NarL/FixJ family, contains REC and HTH domains [Streptomyces zhaozhouensis]|uniref:DNA-binding response regulator, NarL/FixJ family, contains REC and HTH domains n=1 Tax=Streptomyces zhaozhouensis TaxID=1300267 RepID=A0A286E3W4_9ACTN|nr:response regulator transcription factor [Streptomyces zhaozhouensis]SOD65559.1 DNA-binding response regulator, NarL/FixJ family, contains REC and HTH domains [Streptomyces zhaozhouensis]
MYRVTILVAGETALLREALTELLQAQPDMRVLGQVAGERELLLRAADLNPHVILLEPWKAMGRTLHSLRRTAPESAVLTLPYPSAGADPRALRATGPLVHLPRSAGWNALLTEVRRLAPAAVRDAVTRPVPALSQRETEVLRGVATAMTNQQIGRALGITTGTVKRHLHAAFRKLNAVSRLDAVAQALAAGMLTMPLAGFPSSEMTVTEEAGQDAQWRSRIPLC